MACAASTESAGPDGPDGAADFAPDRPYRLSPNVSLRPEPFGALVYDFATRRLSFLKTRPLVSVVRELAQEPSVVAALDTANVPSAERPAYLRALAELARTGIIEPR